MTTFSKTLPLSPAEVILCGRLIAVRLGWLGLLGLLLIALWGLAEFVWLPQQQAKIESSEADIRLLRREIFRLTAEGQRNLAPQAKLDALLATFPGRRQLPDELARLSETLAASGVRVDSAEYQPDSSKAGDFSAITVTMVVKVPYPRLRALLNAVREKLPTVALEDVQVKRDAVSVTEAEARLRFKLFMRRQA